MAHEAVPERESKIAVMDSCGLYKEYELLDKIHMEGIQLEVLVVLLYLSLVYEIITGIKRRGQQSIEKMRKVSVRLGKPSRGNDRMTGTRLQTRITDNSHQTYRHFVQMRILARD